VNHVKAIKDSARQGMSASEIARKIYLTYPTSAFVGQEEVQYEILNAVAIQFSVPIAAVQVAGSAKVGRSFHKDKEFVHGQSDLDIAIIDERLYLKYMGFVFTASRGYNDGTVFPRKKGISSLQEYLSYLSKGIFRPDLMPYGPERAAWVSFFGNLTDNYRSLFSSISGFVYASELFFASKQRSAIKTCLSPEVL
jgi:hypothetical protein